MSDTVAPTRHEVLDAASRRYRIQMAQRRAAVDRATVWAAQILVFAAFWICLIGLTPLATGPSPLVSLVRQASFFGLAGAALVLIAARWRVALALIARSWAMLMVFAAMVSTVAWSQFPLTSIKRITVYLLLYITAIGIAAVLRTPRLYLPPVAIALTAVLGAELLATVALPDRAWTPIGLAGIHSSKNLAGMVGMVLTLTFAALLIAVRQPFLFWALVGLLIVSFGFLALTLSKTSFGIALVCVFGLIPAFAIMRRSPAFGALGVIAVVALAGAITAMTGALSLSTADWATITTGDPTLTSRDEIWHASLHHIAQKPWFGFGYGAVWSMWPDFHPLDAVPGFWTGDLQTMLILNQSHNGYIDLFLHGGAYFFAVVVFFVLKTLIDILAAAFRPSGDRWDMAGQCLFAGFFVGTVLNNLLESTLFFPDGLLGILLVFFTIAASAWRYSELEPRRTQPKLTGIWVNPRLRTPENRAVE